MTEVRKVRAVLYTRVSTQRQVHEGQSLETQDEALRTKAEREGWSVAGVFSDAGVSGRNLDDRAAMLRALEFAAENLQAGDVFAVYSISRLARNALDGLSVTKFLRSKGIRLFDTSMEYSDSPGGNMILNSLLSVAQFQSDENRVRSRAGMERNKREGRYNGRAPFGYRNCSNKLMPALEVQDDEAQAVREVFARIDSGQSQTQVALYLLTNDAYLRYGKKENGPHLGSVKTAIRRIIENRVYVSQQIDRSTGEIIQSNWKPIVTEELFESANARLAKRSSGRDQTKTEHLDIYPLKRVLKCSRCGSKFTGYVSKHRYHYYQCIGRDCHKRERIRVEAAHEQFLDLLSTSGGASVLLEEGIKKVREVARDEILDINRHRQFIERKIEELTQKKKKYLDAMVDGKISQTDFDWQRNDIEEEIVRHQQSLLDFPPLDERFIEEAILRLKILLEDPREHWSNSDANSRANLALVYFPNRILCEGGELRTSELLGIPRHLVESNNRTRQMAPLLFKSSNSIVGWLNQFLIADLALNSPRI